MTPNTMRAAAEARALMLTLALVARMDWRLGPGPLLPQAFAQYLYVPDPQMLLVPTTSGLDFAIRQVAPVVRETRSDALIVSRPTEGNISFALAIWASGETAWTWPLALWCGTDSDTWLVPPPLADEPLGFRLRNALHYTGQVPWSDPQTRMEGYVRAQAWTAGAMPDQEPVARI